VAVTLENIPEDGEAGRVASVELYNGTDEDAEELDSKSPHEWVGADGAATLELFAELNATGERDIAVEVTLLSMDRDRTSLT